MAEGAAFREFADRLLAGEDDATRELLSRYSSQLLALARRRLGPRLRVKEDPEDVLQSVLRTFFRRLDTGELDLRGWGGLWGILSLIALRKCQHREERYAAARRDVGREVSLSRDGQLVHVRIPNRGPTPQEEATFADLITQLLRGMNERDRRAFEGLLAGEPAATVAARLGCSERTVQRTLLRVRQRLSVAAVLGED
jgi:RNA polymerase sigma factor (sigma-70 family)